jgi:hypothetical protein
MGDQMKTTVKHCRVCGIPSPSDRKACFINVKVSLGSWDGEEDAEDESIFFYMDGEPLEIGSIIAEDLIVVDIYESEPIA